MCQVKMKGAGADGVKDKPAATESKPAAAEPSKQQEPPAQEGKAASQAQQGGERVTIVVPDIGDANDVEVIEIMVAVGDTVSKEQSLITVESDKASMEVPASHAGVVTAVKVKLGDKEIGSAHV